MISIYPLLNIVLLVAIAVCCYIVLALSFYSNVKMLNQRTIYIQIAFAHAQTPTDTRKMNKFKVTFELN